MHWWRGFKGLDLEHVEGLGFVYCLFCTVTHHVSSYTTGRKVFHEPEHCHFTSYCNHHLRKWNSFSPFKALQTSNWLCLIWIPSQSRIALWERLVWSRGLIWWQTQLKEPIIIQRQRLAVWAQALSLDLISPNGRLIPLFSFSHWIRELEAENQPLIHSWAGNFMHVRFWLILI